MQHDPRALALVLLLGLLGTPSPEDRLEFRVPQTETVEIRRLVDLDLYSDGTVGILGVDTSEVEYGQFVLHLNLETLDEDIAWKGDEVLAVTRTFLLDGSHVQVPLHERLSDELPIQSALNEKSIRFERESSTLPFEREPTEGELDANLLDALDIDLLVPCSVPPHAVSAGSRWEIPVDCWVGMAFPVSGIPVDVAATDPETWRPCYMIPVPHLPVDLGAWIDGARGRVEAVYTGRDPSNPTNGVVEIEFEVQTEADVLDEVRQTLGRWGEIVTFDEARISGEWKGRAQLIWDLDGGRPVELRSHADVWVLYSLSGSVPRKRPGDVEILLREEWTGTLTTNTTRGPR